MNKKIISLTLCLFNILNAFSSFKNELPINSDSTLLVNITNKNITFFYHDNFAWGSFGFVKANNKLTISINGAKVLISPDKYQYPFIIYDNEKVYFSEAGDELNLRTNDSVRNFELDYFKNLQKKTSSLTYFGKPKGNVSNNLSYHESEYLKRYNILTKDYNDKKITTRFYRDAIVLIKSYLIENIFTYCNVNIDSKIIVSPKVFFDDASFSQLFTYKFALIKTSDFLFKNFFNESSVKRMHSYYGDSALNFILSKRIYDSLRIAKKISVSSYDFYLRACTSQFMKSQIEKLYNSFVMPKTINTRGTFVVTRDGKEINLDSLIQHNTNKIYFIDFWASWCAPCLKELPFEKELINKVTNKKIEFLFISTDEVNTDWLRAIKKEQLEQYENSYRILNASSSEFLKHIKFSTIPRYLIVGTKGKIIDADALRPSNKELLIKLNRL